jgi:hypothetical protein
MWPFLLASLVPLSCSRSLLQGLTPYVIDDSNGFLHDLIFAAAPFVLP